MGPNQITPRTFTVWSLDVWGNCEEGYDVNDRCRVGAIDIPDGLDASEILALLCAEGFISHPELGEVDDSSEGLWFVNERATGRPVLQVERLD